MALFAFFGLWETTLLAAAGAASVPVLIDPLDRRWYVVVTWAAMRFCWRPRSRTRGACGSSSSSCSWWRTALVLLVVLAMASVMPWAENLWAAVFPGAAGGVIQRNRWHHVLVIDGSLSMNLANEGSTCFERARQLARQRIKHASAGDGFSVLLMKDNPTWIVGETSQDARKVAREVEDIQATHGNASVPATLGMVLGQARGQRRPLSHAGRLLLHRHAAGDVGERAVAGRVGRE